MVGTFYFLLHTFKWNINKEAISLLHTLGRSHHRPLHTFDGGSRGTIHILGNLAHSLWRHSNRASYTLLWERGKKQVFHTYTFISEAWEYPSLLRREGFVLSSHIFHTHSLDPIIHILFKFILHTRLHIILVFNWFRTQFSGRFPPEGRGRQ